MAAIDSLLSLASSQNADTLRLAVGEAPTLERGEQPIPLSMPPLDRELTEVFLFKGARAGGAA